MQEQETIEELAQELSLEAHAEKALHVVGQIIGGVALQGGLAKEGAIAAQEVVARILEHQRYLHQAGMERAVASLRALRETLPATAQADLDQTIAALEQDAAANTVDVGGHFLAKEWNADHRAAVLEELFPSVPADQRQVLEGLLDKAYPVLVRTAPSNALVVVLEERHRQQAELSRDEKALVRDKALLATLWKHTDDEDLWQIRSAIGQLLGIDDQAVTRAQLKAVFDHLPSTVTNTAMAWGFHDSVARDELAEALDQPWFTRLEPVLKGL